MIAVECPVGTFENEGACEWCPIGQYQDKTGQTSCKDCPYATAWDMPGAAHISYCMCKYTIEIVKK